MLDTAVSVGDIADSAVRSLSSLNAVVSVVASVIWLNVADRAVR